MKALLDLAVPAVTFLLLLAVGLDLAPADFARVRRQPRVLAAGLVGPLLVLPPLALLLVVLSRPSSDLQAGLLLVAACPIGGISNTYSYLARASTALSVTLTVCSSLLAVLTIPALALAFRAALGHPMGFAAPLPLILAQLLLMLALPVALGMWVRFSRPVFAGRSQSYLRALGFVGVAALIVLIVASDPVVFLHGLRDSVPLAATFIAASFLAGWLVGAATGASPAGSIHAGHGVRHAEHGRGRRHCADAGRTLRVRLVRDDVFPDRDSADAGRDRRLSPVATNCFVSLPEQHRHYFTVGTATVLATAIRSSSASDTANPPGPA